jgi:hypothetical protein
VRGAARKGGPYRDAAYGVFCRLTCDVLIESATPSAATSVWCTRSNTTPYMLLRCRWAEIHYECAAEPDRCGDAQRENGEHRKCTAQAYKLGEMAD